MICRTRVISAKNLAPAFVLSGQQPGSLFDVRRYMSPPLFVPETMRADRLLAEMKRNRSHLAIVIGGSWAIGQVRDALTEAEQRLQLQAWQLRQLIPDEARGAVEVERK